MHFTFLRNLLLLSHSPCAPTPNPHNPPRTTRSRQASALASAPVHRRRAAASRGADAHAAKARRRPPRIDQRGPRHTRSRAGRPHGHTGRSRASGPVCGRAPPGPGHTRAHSTRPHDHTAGKRGRRECTAIHAPPRLRTPPSPAREDNAHTQKPLRNHANAARAHSTEDGGGILQRPSHTAQHPKHTTAAPTQQERKPSSNPLPCHMRPCHEKRRLQRFAFVWRRPRSLALLLIVVVTKVEMCNREAAGDEIVVVFSWRLPSTSSSALPSRPLPQHPPSTRRGPPRPC